MTEGDSLGVIEARLRYTSKGPLVVGRPGGPQGPFYCLVTQQGSVVAAQVLDPFHAELFAHAWVDIERLLGEIAALHARLDAAESRAQVLLEVNEERKRQDAKWGEQNHPPELWLAIAGEEFGELSTAILGERFRDQRIVEDMEKEAIQLAAVLVSFVECRRRVKAREGTTP